MAAMVLFLFGEKIEQSITVAILENKLPAAILVSAFCEFACVICPIVVYIYGSSSHYWEAIEPQF